RYETRNGRTTDLPRRLRLATPVTMPQLGETVVEGTITKWLKHEGDTVERDEPLFEISTDKVDTEVPSPLAGKVLQILVPEGETVAVGAQLVMIETNGAGQAEAPAAPADGPRRQILAPLVRRLADEHGIDLARVRGTGTGGRITKKDVQEFIDSGGAGAAAPPPAPAARTQPAAQPAPAPVAPAVPG